MRSLLLLGACCAFCFGSMSAQQTVVVTSAAGADGAGRFADGSAWPTTGGFTFEVGIFAAGFDPAKEARATWLAAWTPLGSTVAAGAVNAWFRDGASELFSISGTSGGSGAATGGEQYYVWGATTRSPRAAAEWILLTNTAWLKVAGGTARLPDMFTTTDAGTVAVFGELVRGGRGLESAPAFPGELRLVGQAADFAVVAGEPATLSVKAGGSGFAYQWYAGRKGDTARPLPGARQATYTLPSVPSTATFWARVSDGVNAIDSETITLTATDAGAGVAATQTVVAASPEAEGRVTVAAEISFAGAPSRVEFAALLPAGWQLVSSESAGARGPAAGASELIEWSWSVLPASPVTLRYTVAAPAGAGREPAVTALLTVVRDGVTSRHLVQPEALRLRAGGGATAVP